MSEKAGMTERVRWWRFRDRRLRDAGRIPPGFDARLLRDMGVEPDGKVRLARHVVRF